jgi:hypothetical protein
VPNITRIVGMHNQVDAANTDKVWVGMILHHEEQDQWQFVSLNGRRYGSIRATPQPMTWNRSQVENKWEQMYREKLGHGYNVVDWSEPRYALVSNVRYQGTLNDRTRTMMPNGILEPWVTTQGRRVGAPTPTPVARPVRPAPTIPTPPPAPVPEPVAVTPAQLSAYITERAGHTPPAAPEPTKPATPASQPQPQRPVRKARRLDF